MCVHANYLGHQDGYAIRDPDSTSYTAGAIETAEEFGKRINLEAWKRGWSRAKKKVLIGDGAEWIWNLVTKHFPDAMHIVDLYRARQHLWEMARQRIIRRRLDMGRKHAAYRMEKRESVRIATGEAASCINWRTANCAGKKP